MDLPFSHDHDSGLMYNVHCWVGQTYREPPRPMKYIVNNTPLKRPKVAP